MSYILYFVSSSVSNYVCLYKKPASDRSCDVVEINNTVSQLRQQRVMDDFCSPYTLNMLAFTFLAQSLFSHSLLSHAVASVPAWSEI